MEERSGRQEAGAVTTARRWMEGNGEGRGGAAGGGAVCLGEGDGGGFSKTAGLGC